MPAVEHLLIQLSLANTAAELGTMETINGTMAVRALRVEEAATNCATCKVHTYVAVFAYISFLSLVHDMTIDARFIT